MFILRKITGEGNEINVSLGKSYNYINKEFNPKEFEDVLTEKFGRLNEDATYAYLIYNDGADIMPLYKGQRNYIMTESGKTFNNLTPVR